MSYYSSIVTSDVSYNVSSNEPNFFKPAQQLTYFTRQEPISTICPIMMISPYIFEGYCVQKPIMIRIEHINDAYTAKFEEAEIACIAATPEEAIQLLKAQIVYKYETYKNSSRRLAPKPASQLAILKEYVFKIKTVKIDDLYGMGMVPGRKIVTLEQMNKDITKYLEQKIVHARN